MSKNISDYLVEMLVEAGVKRVYGVTGDSLNPVNDAIRRDGRLQWIRNSTASVVAWEVAGLDMCI
jgi:pyruvate dehydrogenase (quinone)